MVKLQSGEPIITKGWQFICDLSKKEYNKLYVRLDIKLEECGESFFHSMIKPIMEELKAKKMVEESKGAMCIFNGKYKTPLIILKSDGAIGYDSTDIAAAHYRLLKLKCDKVIYVTDIGQEFHFKLIFDAAERAGWYAPTKAQLLHMGFGIVLGKSGKKIKARDGTDKKIVELIDEARDRALVQIQQRLKENGKEKAVKTQLKDDKKIKEAAEILGIAIIKYFNLRLSRTSNYHFSYEGVLDTKGNTAVYLLFNYAKIELNSKKG